MPLLNNPSWISSNLFEYKSLDQFPNVVLDTIRDRLKSKISANPIVTILIAAWNEETNIVRCLDSLSYSQTTVPFDIIVINNNSTDATQLAIDRLGIKSYFQGIQGCGPARDLGQQHAKGKYILVADADCYYPSKWIEIMTQNLMKNSVVFVYGRFSFLGLKSNPRWQFSIYDVFRDILVEIRHIKRPYLNAYGISMGYIREYGIKEGYLTRNIRGDDGRLCFELMKYGIVKIVRDNASRVWTSSRTLNRDGSFTRAILRRVLRELARFDKYFKAPEPHNTQTSSNEDYTISESIEIIKRKYNPFRSLRSSQKK